MRRVRRSMSEARTWHTCEAARIARFAGLERHQGLWGWHVPIHTHTNTHIHTHIHTYIHTYIHTHACMHACIHTYIHTNACVCVCARARASGHQLDGTHQQRHRRHGRPCRGPWPSSAPWQPPGRCRGQSRTARNSRTALCGGEGTRRRWQGASGGGETGHRRRQGGSGEWCGGRQAVGTRDTHHRRSHYARGRGLGRSLHTALYDKQLALPRACVRAFPPPPCAQRSILAAARLSQSGRAAGPASTVRLGCREVAKRPAACRQLWRLPNLHGCLAPRLPPPSCLPAGTRTTTTSPARPSPPLPCALVYSQKSSSSSIENWAPFWWKLANSSDVWRMVWNIASPLHRAHLVSSRQPARTARAQPPPGADTGGRAQPAAPRGQHHPSPQQTTALPPQLNRF